ncbi:hypothetical protein Vafri_8903 [Volvox africanus]|uniref:Uncharacterized protein n=1 Tax=Volvox africanus TaxID=51714 RepID=A0A8J4EZG8_9CHLO|nr:hypothetical protein Vafri_8903 [Volvox africanus]
MRECPVLHATLDDIQKPFEAFIEKHENKISQAGIAKIVAPDGWSPRRQGYSDDLDFIIERPIRQHATGSRGLYRGLYIEETPLSLRRGFRPQALAPENQPPPATDPRDLERKFWKNVTLRPPLYGADVLGSLFDEDCPGWNLRRLDTVLSRVLHEAGHSLPGVSEPYLYFGTWRSTFAWHTEDLDLYSVNYLHFGAPKQWYCIPPASRKRFEGLVKGMLPDLFKACPEFFRHKELIISPQLLDTFAIPYIKAIQEPREFIINFPGAYHAGYNCGYNCAESVNFGTRRWVPLGATAAVCKCNPDSVTIDMRLFRDLVPARLLPPAIFQDTSSEEEGIEDEVEEEGRWRPAAWGGHDHAGGRCAMAGAVTSLADEGVAAAALAPPRRRGRPRKRPLLADAAGGMLDTGAAATGPDAKRQWIVQDAGCCGGASAIVASAPRGRGRPPKAVTAAAAAAAHANVAASTAVAKPAAEDRAGSGGIAGSGVLHAALPGPRRRGRPPKQSMTDSSGPAAAGIAVTSPMAAALPAAPPGPPKRPRGRPRKHPPLQQPRTTVAAAVPGLAVVSPIHLTTFAVAPAAAVAAMAIQGLLERGAVKGDGVVVSDISGGGGSVNAATGPIAVQYGGFEGATPAAGSSSIKWLQPGLCKLPWPASFAFDTPPFHPAAKIDSTVASE